MKRLPGDVPNITPAPDLRGLSPRRIEVVQLLAKQMSTTRIAADMSISVDPLHTRIRGALRKLGTDDREEAVRTARDRGLV